MLFQIALTLAVLLGFCGLALDVGMMQLKKLQLQNAADAAALGAMYKVGNATASLAAAQSDAALNGFTDNGSTTRVFLDSPPTAGAYAGNTLGVQTTITQQVNPLFFSGSRTLSARSTALAPITGCMYLLSQVSTNPYSLDAVNQSMTADCAIYIARSYTLTDSSGAQFYVGSSSGVGTITPAPFFNVPQQADPLAYLQSPPFPNNCSQTNLSVTTPRTLNPGLYCGGLSISNNVSVTFHSGIYLIAGNLDINGAVLSNSAGGITFYMTSYGTYNSGVASIQNCQIHLSAPPSGILFFSDRAITPGQTMLTIQNNDPWSTFDGVLYLPGQGLLAVNTPMAGNHYFGIVADYFRFNNTALKLTSDYSSISGNPFQPLGGGLVE